MLPIFFLLPFSLIGQDTLRTKHIEYSWQSLALRTGVGMQRFFYAEIGPAYVFHQFDSREGFGSGILYTTFEWTPDKNRYGIKAGAELNQTLSVLGLELKTQWSGDQRDIVLTPKIGAGLGVVDICYGYNISFYKYPFGNIGKHQFSLVLNYTPEFFKKHH